MDVSLTGIREEGQFPLLRLPPEVRNIIYHHALDSTFPSAIFPKSTQEIQPLHSAAASFTNLQLTSREVYREASEVLYRKSEFIFLISETSASLLGFVLPFEPFLPQFQVKLENRSKTQCYMNRIQNIDLWPDCCDWTWLYSRGTCISEDQEWERAMQIVSNELALHFPSLRRLTLDYRYPGPTQFFRPTFKEWSSVSSIFEKLQAERPHIRIEVLTWQLLLPRTEPPQEYQEVRMKLAEYTEMLSKATTAEERA